MPNPYAPKQSSLGIVVAQPDADGDGVGDVCDTCPNSDVRQVVDLFCCNSDADCQGPNPIGVNPTNRCVPIAPAVPAFPPPDPLAISPCPGFAGRCAMGRDLDRDFVADNCDSCPPTTACKSCSSSASCGVVCGESHNTGQTDSDGDGVGDVCDNCAGKGSFPPEVDHGKDLNNIAGMVCNVDADDCSKFDCVPGDPTCIPSDKHSVCVPGKIELGTSGSLELKPAHCSRFPDKDGDGLGNICDNCVNTPNVETSGTGDNELNNQPNCNLANEIAIGTVPYPFVGDSCDPNPCNRPGISFAPHAPNPKDVTGDLWVTMSYDAQILPNSQQKQNVPGQVPFPHQYTGTPVATVGSRYCQCDDALLHDALKCRTVCPIDAPNHYDTSEQWSEASVAPTPPLGPFQLPPNPVDSDFPADAELQNLSLAAPPKVLPTPTDNLGAYLSAPKSVSWDVTRNDAIHFDFLPGTSSPVSAFGVIGVLWTGVRNVPQAPLAVSTFLPYSNRYNPSFYGGVDPTESGGNAKSACPTCEDFACFVCDFDVDMKDLIVHPETEQLIAQSALGGSVITDSISPAARSAVFDTTARWLTVAERGGWLHGESLGFATLSSDGSSVKSVLAHRNGILTPVTRRAGGGGVDTAVAMLAAVDPGPFPASRSDFGAVLSDNEQGIFVFGGKLASGQLANDVWLFDIGSGRWWELSFSGPTPRKVLAATYIPQTRSLWLVDAGTTAFSFARLLRYDIPTQKFYVVGTWPRTPIMDRIELSGAPDGDLLLTGSSSWLKHVVGVVLHPVGPNGNVVTVTGAFKRPGKLAIEPTLSVSLLTLPLASNGPTGVEHVVIPADDVLFKPKKKGKGPKPPFIGIWQCL